MVARFYDIIGNEFITEIPVSELPKNGQKIHLPNCDEDIYIVITSIIDYRKHGNNYPTCAYITVVNERNMK